MNEEIKQKVYAIVLNSHTRLTPIEVEKKIAVETRAERKVIKSAIRELVHEELLRYTNCGCSFLERSFDIPVRVSRRIVIKPPHRTYISEREDIVIDIKSGTAFGDGAHPSTYLVLRALDSILSNQDYLRGWYISKALDVGTGTGILAIAAAKLGVREVIGIDINPVAVFEAKDNVGINNLAEQITISDTPLEEIRSSFPIIMANIYSKTLEMLCPLLVERIEEGGLLVLSGIMADESEPLLEMYMQRGLILIYRDAERNWVCFILRKPR